MSGDGVDFALNVMTNRGGGLSLLLNVLRMVKHLMHFIHDAMHCGGERLYILRALMGLLAYVID